MDLYLTRVFVFAFCYSILDSIATNCSTLLSIVAKVSVILTIVLRLHQILSVLTLVFLNFPGGAGEICPISLNFLDQLHP